MTMTTVTKPSTLLDCFSDLRSGEWDDTPVAKYYDIEVVHQYSASPNSWGYTVRRWPGPQKNVHLWVELKNGKAVGWNESPSHGWTFPVISLKKV